MVEYIDREAAITVIEEKQKELCPLGLWRRDKANDREKFDAWQEIIDELNSVPAVSVPKWISVKDRLPEPGENPVLAGNAELGIVNMAWYHRGKRIWETPSGFSCSFTHWMPLPEAPKGG